MKKNRSLTKIVHLVIFWLIMLLVSVSWLRFWNNAFWQTGYSVSTGNLSLPEILKQLSVAIHEELVFRFIPFTIVSIIWLIGTHIKVSTTILMIIIIIFIIIVQIQFGLAHVLWDADLRKIMNLTELPTVTEKMQHIVLQGGMGIILICTYWRFYKESKGVLRYIQIVPLFTVTMLHMITNLILIVN